MAKRSAAQRDAAIRTQIGKNLAKGIRPSVLADFERQEKLRAEILAKAIQEDIDRQEDQE